MNATQVTQLALAIVVMVIGHHSAFGAIFVHDDFEYATQAEFEAAWPVMNTPGATLDGSRFVSGARSVHLTLAPQLSRNARSFPEVGLPTAANPVTWSFRFYDEAPTQDPTNVWSNLQDSSPPSGNGQLIAMGLNDSLVNSDGVGPRYMARILGRDGGSGVGAWFKLDDPGAPARSPGWHELTAVIDGGSVRFYVDGILSKTVSGVAARSYDNAYLSSGPSSAYGANVDDFHLDNNFIPEPATLTAAVMSCLLLRRRLGQNSVPRKMTINRT